jgi:predicted RNA-binding Zn-ribbon protein involved in translation (DUF1610 family)
MLNMQKLVDFPILCAILRTRRKPMRKVHLKVVLDVFAEADDDANLANCIHTAFDKVQIVGNAQVDIIDFSEKSCYSMLSGALRTEGEQFMRINFVCPECGCIRMLEQIMADAVVVSKVGAIDEKGVLESYVDEITEGTVDRYQCAACGWVIGNGGSSTELFAWLKERNMLGD